MRRKPTASLRMPQQLGRTRGQTALRIWTPPVATPAKPRRRPARRRKPAVDAGAEIAPGPYLRSEELARLEAALTVAREPLSPRRLAKLARLTDGTRARSLLKELKKLQESSGSAFRVEQLAGGFQLLTRGPFGPWVRRLLATPPETRLSAAALETLAIVAYRQPVTRAEVEAIRGVGCEEMLRHLLDRDFVAIGGRTEELGRPNVYQTTSRFLRAFGLARIEDGRVNLCGLFQAGSASGKGIGLLLGCLQAGGLLRLAKRIGEAVPDPESFCGVAGFRFGRTAAASFSIGDAALMIPPFTGNGMSMALEAAEQAIQPAMDFATGRISWEEAATRSDAAQRRHFRRRMRLASMIHPVMTSRPGLKLLEMAASAQLLPYGALYRLLR